MPFCTDVMIAVNNKSSPPHADYLSLSLQPKLLSQLSMNQHVVYSTQILKLNEDNKTQSRIFLLTNHAIYNILKPESILRRFLSLTNTFTIRRRVPLLAVYGLSVGKGGHAFVLHVINESDYFYKMEMGCIQLIRYVAREYQAMVGKSLNIYRKQDIVLVNYCTHKQHVKQKKDMKPKQQPTHIPASQFPPLQEVTVHHHPSKYELMYPSAENIPFDLWRQVRQSDPYLKEGRYYWVNKIEGKWKKQHNEIECKDKRIMKQEFVYQGKEDAIVLQNFLLGGNLMEQVTKRVMKRQQALFHIAQIVLFIESMHSQSYMIGQLTLNNMYISNYGYLFFSVHPTPFASSTFCSIPAVYLPPEDILCEGHSKSADIWMLGICAWRILQGIWPFQGSSVKEIMGNIINQELREGQLLLRKMLVKQAYARPSIAQIKSDSMFSSIKWQQIDDQFLKPPFIPDISHFKQNSGSILLLESQK